MKNKYCLLSLFALTIFALTACDNVTTDPDPAEPVVNKLIFQSEAESGGTVKVELNDTFIESLLTGNNSGVTTPLLLPATPALPVHESSIKVNLSDIDYYGQIISGIECVSDETIGLIWEGPLGEYYEGPNGYLYLDDVLIGNQYVLQGDTEIIDTAIVNSFYYMNCTSSDGVAYKLSFYPSNHVLSHGIATRFSVEEGSFTGIIRLHKVGEGYLPYLDLLF